MANENQEQLSEQGAAGERLLLAAIVMGAATLEAGVAGRAWIEIGGVLESVRLDDAGVPLLTDRVMSALRAA
jgi:hypothetical protein